MKGFDAAFDVSHLIPKIKAAGLGFVCRYYGGSLSKDLTRDEATALLAADIDVVTVFEGRGDLVSSFTSAGGQRDAQIAYGQAIERDHPPGAAIYFAVDFDASAAEIAQLIIPYFLAARDYLARQPRRFSIGAYGSGLVLSSLRDIVQYRWLAQATGWRSSRGFTGAHIRQGPSGDPYHFGHTIDTDEALVADYGGWRGAAAPTPVPVVPTIPKVADLQRALIAAGLSVGPAGDDGKFGKDTIAALSEYYRRHP